MLNSTPITGLGWLQRIKIKNGKNSFVVPFPDTHPINIVDHGFAEFNYGHYGIHLGQADVLTFLGNSETCLTGYFIDCRKNSKTYGMRYNEKFNPTTERSLYIPPGVAHTFDGLGKTYTINNYQLYLPDPDKLFSNDLGWTPEMDVLNIPLNIPDAELPSLTPMHNLAGHGLYKAISGHHKNNIKKYQYMHPERKKVQLNSGELVEIVMRKHLTQSSDQEEPTKSNLGIDGLYFEKIPSIKTGSHSSIIPILYGCPFYIVEHGNERYDFDSYGLHKGQEDNLIFLGNPNKSISAEFVDCRKGSITLHKKIQLTFSPSSVQKLVIPAGIAHAFWGLEDVFTFNRPRLFLSEHETYVPAHDTYDWPIENLNYPIIDFNTIPASEDYYEYVKKRQKKAYSKPIEKSTPLSLMVKNEHNKSVRVIVRKI